MQQLIGSTVIVLVIVLVISVIDIAKGKLSLSTFWYNLSVFVTLISLIFLIHIFVEKHEMLQSVGLVGVMLYSIGAILGGCIVPLFVWAIYFVLKNAQNKKLIKICNSDKFSQEFNVKLNSLKELLDVQAITPLEFDTKKKLLIRDTERLVKSDENVNLKKQQLKKLEEALNAGVITEEEYRIKVDNLQ